MNNRDNTLPPIIKIDKLKGYIAYPFRKQNIVLDDTSNDSNTSDDKWYYGIPICCIQKVLGRTPQYMEHWMKQQKNNLEKMYGDLINKEDVFIKVKLGSYKNFTDHPRRIIRLEYFSLLYGKYISFTRTEMFKILLHRIIQIKNDKIENDVRNLVEEVMQKVSSIKVQGEKCELPNLGEKCELSNFGACNSNKRKRIQASAPYQLDLRFSERRPPLCISFIPFELNLNEIE